jgi:hypothetical protein
MWGGSFLIYHFRLGHFDKVFPLSQLCAARDGLEKDAGWLRAGAIQSAMSNLPVPCAPVALGTLPSRLSSHKIVLPRSRLSQTWLTICHYIVSAIRW